MIRQSFAPHFCYYKHREKFNQFKGYLELWFEQMQVSVQAVKKT